jgi:hypothetical protein
MTTASPTSQTLIRLKPISLTGGYLLLAGYGAWVGFTLLRSLGGEVLIGVMFLIIYGLIGIPVAMLADNLMAAIQVDDRGIIRTGLVHRQTAMGWDEITRITLHSGRGAYRDIRLRSNRQQVAFSNMRPEFWRAARAIIGIADQRHITVNPPWFSSRTSWFAGEKA